MVKNSVSSSGTRYQTTSGFRLTTIVIIMTAINTPNGIIEKRDNAYK